MRTRTQRVRLEPGFKPPLVELTPNLVTALVFTDSTGQPWPIVNSVLGSGALFRTEVLEVEKGNQIIISPLSNHGHSNLVVTLKDNDIPMVIRLATASALKSGREVDTLIIFQVAGNGPSALTTGELPRLPIPVNDSIYAVLDGLVPPGGRLLETSPAPEGERAIESGGSIYLRTGRSLLWPAPRARVAGPGRVWVYELPMVSVVLLSSGGEVGELTIEGIDAPRTAQLGGRAGE
jgi:intracellular multiplication protein IcmK